MRRLGTLAAFLLCACASVRNPGTFFVNVGTYWQPRQANIVREDIASHGYDAFVEETMDTLRSARPIAMLVTAERGETYPTPTNYRVRVGPFHDETEAVRARDELRAAGFRAYVVHH